ncbi:DddA-like double-stranded DNA deaminase toxin [Micromonospora yangpuensis]|uniref:SCP1.201-like deaminase n=1 Tax=Micromonospora yangpuensis TaxID=683228 RepID=A0A1C6UWK2_9ACTN|nr:DddA-like double-stranded DNA deaminase toxin [Micromonospora yangpuensis]GGM25340.1 hypothetical protein GCM10012279_49740 [Micromonospora yangpuensis]SCL58361.1 SCP1.201-like deaminase [Micromonospora yangpuensis]
MSVSEIAAVLQAVIEGVADQRRRLAAVTDDLQRDRDRFHAVTAASGHRLVGETLRQQTEATQRLRHADHLLSVIPQALAEFAAAIGATVQPSSTTGEPQQPTKPRSQPTEPATPTTVGDPAGIPAAVTRLARRLRPWQDGENAKAYAYDSNHQHLTDEPFTSGRIASAAHGLRPVRGGGHPVTVTDHVEGHVAARMRTPNGPREVTLVINKTPCDDRPFGCDRLLPHLIPTGSRLTVYVVEADGPRFHRTYQGTGKAITT